MNTVTVVGAGPAGMMAAIKAAREGAKVLLLERNVRPGIKLSITGKGRCNITNDCNPDEITFPGDGRFLRSALSQFSPSDTIAFFEDLGVPLVTERGRRVFPASGKASDIVNALLRHMHALGVTIENGHRVRSLTELNPNGRASHGCGAVIIATGGLSYPKTGSTGDGYELARQAGHIVTELRPSLVPLVSSGTYCADMQGLSLRNVTFRLLDGNNKTVFREGPGEMLFTHFGVSGPLVLSASAHYSAGLRGEIDLKPGLTEQQLDARILRDFAKFSAKTITNALTDLLHKTMIPAIIMLCRISPQKRTAEITRGERAALLRIIKHFPVNITGTRPIDEAVVTRGGVSLHEIDPKTMQSKLRKGLYFAGEVLDLDAYTGGYNLQIAWSTGWVAGKNAGGCYG